MSSFTSTSSTSTSSTSSQPPMPPCGQPSPKPYKDLVDKFIEADSDSDDDVFGAHAEAGLESDPKSGADTGVSPEMQEVTDDRHNLITPQMQRSTRAVIERAARRASTSTQLGLIFVGIQAVESGISRILVNQPRFSVDEALHKTISAYSLGVLLSEKLREYKRSSTDVSIIRNNNANIPTNLSKDPYALGVVKAAISEALTQARSRIKKLIGKSIDEKQSIYQLASKIIEGSQFTVSIPLCARLAVLRHVFSDYGTKMAYWDNVDGCLAHCREKAGNNVNGIRKLLAKMLKHDRSTYGRSDTTIIPQDVSEFQQGIDDNL